MAPVVGDGIGTKSGAPGAAGATHEKMQD